MFKLLALFALVIFVNTSCTSDPQSELKGALHKVSENIAEFANHELIVDSLYSQMRPRANITNKSLSSDQVDKKVRTYVSEQYAPVLIKNYSQIYSELKKADKDFSSCEKLVAINPDKNFLSSLCLKEEGNLIEVQYMTKVPSKGWSKAIVFGFEYVKGVLQLVSIELQMVEGAKVHIEGI